MSDEAAFLDALKANPADDTARLVYADWLDERGEADRSAYLRAVVDAVRLCGDGWPNGLAVDHLLRLAEAVPPDWRAETGGRFAVVLLDTDALNRAGSDVFALRRALGCGYQRAVDLVNMLPTRLVDGVTFEEAHRLWTRVRAEVVGGVRLIPADAALPADARRYRVIATYTESGHHRQRWTRPEAGPRAFRDMVASLLGISRDEAAGRIAGEFVVLASDLAPRDVPEWLAAARAAVPSHNPKSGFRIEVVAELQPSPPAPDAE